jgi:hypothetical protein
MLKWLSMPVHYFLENEPYSSLAKNIQPKQWLKKRTINDPPIPSHLNPSIEAYCKSKIFDEELARQYSSTDRINVKFIWVLESQLTLKQFQIYFVSSNNYFCWVNMDNGREDFNYVPQDGSKWN